MNGNAKIGRTTLGYEAHGILTCYLHLEQDGSGQGFGGFRLDAPKGYSKFADFWIRRILDTVGVESWEDLEGKYVRVKGKEFGQIEGIGHITDKRWFYPEKEIEKVKEEENELQAQK